MGAGGADRRECGEDIGEKTVTNKKSLGSIVSINPEFLGSRFLYEFINYIDISSIKEGNLEKTTKIEIKNAPARAKRLVRNGDTILSTVRPNLRAFLYLKNPSPDTVVSTGFAVLRPSEKIDSRFLYYSVINQEFTDYLTNNAKGAAYPAVDTETIARAEIPFPPLPIQQKIATILSAYDDLIENNTRRIRVLEDMTQAIYREWFVNFCFPGHESVRMVESELGLVPEGWEIRCIQDVCSKILSGRTPERNHDEYWNNGTIQWFKTKELQDGYLLNSEETISDQGLKKSSAKLFPEDTIIIALYAAPTLGRMGILTKPATFNQATCAVIPDQNYISMPFLFIVLLNLRDYFHRIAQGATQQNINVQKLKETPFLLPRKEIVISFTTIILPVFENIRTLTIKNQNLRHTRDLLLPKLISGEIDVSELDIRIPKAEA